MIVYKLKDSVEKLFQVFNKKEDMLLYIKNHNLFQDILEASLDAKHPKAWRATSMLGYLIQKNDTRIRPYIMPFIELLGSLKHEGHQRQVFVILYKMELSKSQQGHLFNHALSIWEQVNIIPSTRSYAFKTMVKICRSFPELKKEILLFTTDYYTKTLSPGIKVSFDKTVKKIKRGCLKSQTPSFFVVNLINKAL